MEVHHHPHVEKKNFKEYFLEFLMIFLAVTMGFIAENMREHFVDVRTEKNTSRLLNSNYSLIRSSLQICKIASSIISLLSIV
jgi:hypothetical protein